MPIPKDPSLSRIQKSRQAAPTGGIQIVDASSHEPDTLTYEYVVSDDHRAAHIIERYRTAGVLPHVEQTFAPYAEEFLRLAMIDRLFVYGEPTASIRAKLDGFGAVYLTPFAGFTR